MTSFRFPKKFLCYRDRVRVWVKVSVKIRIKIRVRLWAKIMVRVRVRGNTFKCVFGQTTIRASALDPSSGVSLTKVNNPSMLFFIKEH